MELVIKGESGPLIDRGTEGRTMDTAIERSRRGRRDKKRMETAQALDVGGELPIEQCERGREGPHLGTLL